MKYELREEEYETPNMPRVEIIPEIGKNPKEVKNETFLGFRAGIEGTISCLKRASRLSRSFFKGFKGPVSEILCRSVGSAVFCHNLSSIVSLSKDEAKT